MNSKPDYLLFFIILILAFLVWSNKYQINQIKTNSHVIESECIEILQYRQFGRIDFVCYMGDDYNYSVNEKRVIEQWKNR